MKLITNLIYLSSAEFASKVITFAAIAYLARVLGPVGFGYIEFAGSVLLCAGLIVDQGFGPYGAREIAKAPQRTGEFLNEVVLTRFILALLAYAALVVFAWTLAPAPIVTRLLMLYGLSLLGMPLLLQWVFQGHDQMQAVAAINVIRQTAYAVVIFGLIRTEAQIWLVPFSEIVGVSCAALYGVWLYRRRFKGMRGSGLRLSKRLFQEGVPIGLSQVFWMIRMYGATVVLGLIASAQDVGYFAAAMRILVALHAFIYLYYFNLLPSLARSWQQKSPKFGETLALSLHAIAWLGLLGGVAWVLLAPILIVAAYGPAFAPAGLPLQWLAGLAVTALVSGHYRFALIAAGQQTAEMIAQFLGSAVAVVLIPVGYARGGAGGAASALVVAEVLVLLATWWWAREKLGLRAHLHQVLRPALVLIVVAGLLFVLPAAPLVQLVAASSIIVLLAFVLDPILRNYLVQVATLGPRGLRDLLAKRASEAAPQG